MSSVSEDQPSFPKGSASLCKMMYAAAASAIVSSLYSTLIAKGKTKEESYTAMAEFVGKLKQDGLFQGYSAVAEVIAYAKTCVEDVQERMLQRTGNPRRCGSSYAYDAIDAVRWCCFWTMEDNVSKPGTDEKEYIPPEGFTQQEVALAKKLDAARRAYYVAEREFNRYFSLKAVEAIQEFTTYYSDAIGKIDAEWSGEFNKTVELERKWYISDKMAEAEEG